MSINLSLEQETIVRCLQSNGIDQAKANAFVLFAHQDSLSRIFKMFESIEHLNWNAEVDGCESSGDDLQDYFEAAGSIILVFEDLFGSEVTLSQYLLIKSSFEAQECTKRMLHSFR